MAQRVQYPDPIEPLVQFVEETTPERIVAATQAAAISHDRIQDVYEHAAEVMHF